MPPNDGLEAPVDSAVLLIDLQTDFLDPRGRMPVDWHDAEAVIDAANAILSGQVLRGVLPIAIVNEFSPSARIANFFRHNAAIAGSEGAKQDARIAQREDMAIFAKQRASAFSNGDLTSFLRARHVAKLYVAGVFAEGCVRATVLGAMKLGFEVFVFADAVASNARWKKWLALWSMRRAGAVIVTLDG
jgi:nicotinamidase-related amidase